MRALNIAKKETQKQHNVRAVLDLDLDVAIKGLHVGTAERSYHYNVCSKCEWAQKKGVENIKEGKQISLKTNVFTAKISISLPS